MMYGDGLSSRFKFSWIPTVNVVFAKLLHSTCCRINVEVGREITDESRVKRALELLFTCIKLDANTQLSHKFKNIN